MTTHAMTVALERQLDWLLGEGLGEARVARPRATAHWLVAAIALFGIGVACAVAWLHNDDLQSAQEPATEVQWHECHGAAALDAIPADIVNLRCFDFDDAALPRLAKLSQLQRLDLSGTDVNDQGYSVALQLSDAGVRALAPLTNLRWLSFAGCHDLKGASFTVLEGMPQLEHLDLTYSGIESPAVERLPRLPSLRTLVLSRCMNFHGRSLAAVATIPGIQRLELRACTTLAAKDVLHVAQMKALRHLDLRDCQGRYRGQRASGFGFVKLIDTDGDGIPDSPEPTPPPPVEDGIGITDDVVATLAALPLETLLLGGSESLTDAIGSFLAKMTTLRTLDLGNLPETTGPLLSQLPAGLTALSLDGNSQYVGSKVHAVGKLRALRELGLDGVTMVIDTDLAAILKDLELEVLRCGGMPPIGDQQAPNSGYRRISDATCKALLSQSHLHTLGLARVRFEAPELLGSIATLPSLRRLDLTECGDLAALPHLAAAARLQQLQLRKGRVRIEALRELVKLPLRTLDLQSTRLDAAELQALATSSWPGCTITLPNGQRWRAP